MNKAKGKYFQTALLMDKALLLLLEKKNYEYITVKEVCGKAGVNRSTFYLHYETMNDLLLESMEYLLRQMRDHFHQDSLISRERIENCPLRDLVLITSEYLMPYLEFVKENKKVFAAAISQPAAFQFNETFHKMNNEIFDPIMDRFHFPEWEKKYRLAFYINGIFAVISTWIKGGCVEENGKIAELLIKCINE